MKDLFERNFEWAESYYNNKDYSLARCCYEKTIENDEYSEKSLIRLIQIDIREGNYINARKLLEQYKQIQNAEFIQTYALLEDIEYNFEQSKKYYRQTISDEILSKSALLHLAKIDVEMGNYKEAEKVYNVLIYDKSMKYQALFGFIVCKVLQKDFEKAYELYLKIDKTKLNSEKFLRNYKILGNLLRNKLNINSDEPKFVKDYFVSRIYDNADETLIKQLETRTSRAMQMCNSNFLGDIDFGKILEEVKEKIKDANPAIFGMTSSYIIELDKSVGIKNSIVTNYVRVLYIIGTNSIVTIHPVEVSPKYDNEKFLYDKQLRLKIKG